jgi:uncharacterized membrane protein
MHEDLKFNRIQDLTILGLLIALVAVSTMVIKIPTIATQGYIHLGDSMIFLAAIMFGKRKGAIAGGLGSAMADLLLAYTHWVLPTLMTFAFSITSSISSHGKLSIKCAHISNPCLFIAKTASINSPRVCPLFILLSV